MTIDGGGWTLISTYEYDNVGNLVRFVDPRGNDTLFTVNALNQAVRVQSPELAAGIRYEKLSWYDVNDNLVRTDMVNRNEAGALGANTHFTTICEFDALN